MLFSIPEIMFMYSENVVEMFHYSFPESNSQFPFDPCARLRFGRWCNIVQQFWLINGVTWKRFACEILSGSQLSMFDVMPYVCETLIKVRPCESSVLAKLSLDDYCRIQKIYLPALVSGPYIFFLIKTPFKAVKKVFLIIYN